MEASFSSFEQGNRMKFRVYCPAAHVEDRPMALAVDYDDTVLELKQMVCSRLGVDPDAMQIYTLFQEWWDSSSRNHKHSLLDYKLDQYLWQANVRNGQRLLLETKVLWVKVHCRTVTQRDVKFLHVPATYTVQQLKYDAAQKFGLSANSCDLWGYCNGSKQLCLEDRLQQTVIAANIWDNRSLLLEHRVLRVKVHCRTVTQRDVKFLHVPATYTVQQLKYDAAQKFGLSANSCDLWGYCNGSKQLCLEDRLQQTVIAANIWDNRSLLLEHRVRVPQRRQAEQQAELQPLQAEQQQLQQPKQQQPQFVEVCQMMQYQQQQQHSKCNPPEEQLVHALLEYLSSPIDHNNSCSQTQGQLVELLSRALTLQQHTCSQSSSSSSRDVRNAAAAVCSVEAAEELQQLRSCVVCLDAPRSVMLLPCKHLALCDSCSLQLRHQARNNASSSGGQLRTPCPVCRVPAYQHMPGVILS